jgi:hypothetical protein
MSPSSFCLSGVKECKQFPEEMEKKYPIEYVIGIPNSRLMAEKFYDEELAKITDIARRHEVSQEKETWMACYIAGYNAAATPTGAVWVTVETKLPNIGETVLVEYRSRDLEYRVYIGPEDWWKRNIRRWLDESGEV